jgi:hypothetical protein
MSYQLYLSKILNEDIVDYYKSGDKIFPIFINPTRDDIINIIKIDKDYYFGEYLGLRFGVMEDGKIYVWSSEVDHGVIQNYLDVRFDFRLVYDYKFNRIEYGELGVSYKMTPSISRNIAEKLHNLIPKLSEKDILNSL